MTRQTAPNSSGYTILLVDDDVNYLESARALLEREGHEMIVASTGAEALRLLSERTIDLVLLDYFMPGKTGEQVVTELREFNKEVQVILQTGYSSETPAREMLRRLDIQGYYDKSEGPEKLLLWTDVGLKAVYREGQLQKRVQEALARLRVLNGLLPICVSCKKIRDDNGYWNQIESYIRRYSQAEFSHSLCPDCLARLYPEHTSPKAGS